MQINDGRVVSNFIIQALKNKKISSYKFTDSVNDDKDNEKYPTFLKLMNEKEIIAMLEHLLNIKKLLSITSDINMARNFMKPDIGNPNSSGGSNAQKINYLEAMNMTEEEDRINDNLFDGSARVDNSKPSWGKNDILKRSFFRTIRTLIYRGNKGETLNKLNTW